MKFEIKNKFLSAFTIALILFQAVIPITALAAVGTNQYIYYAGDIVYITGNEMQAGETVNVDITFPDGSLAQHHEVAADSSGNFSDTYVVPNDGPTGEYTVVSAGQISGNTFTTTFDPPKPDCGLVASISSPSNGATFTAASVGGAASVTFTWNTSITYSTTYTVEVKVDGTLISTALSGSQVLNLSVGPHTFQVKAGTSSSDCQNPNQVANASITVNNPVVTNTAPVASSVSISGVAQYGQLLTGNYTYSDADGDAQGTSTFRWLRDGSTAVGTNQTYTTVSADVGHTLTFEVTPVAATGILLGAAVQSSAVSIGKAPLTVTASSHTVAYGDAVPTVTPSYATFVSPDNAAGIDTPPTCATTYTTTSGAGSAQTTSCSGGSDNNYSFSFVSGTVTVGKANATITVNGYSGVYDGLYHGATLVSAVGANSEDLTSSVTMGGETFKNVPGGLASWSFSNGNYNPQSSNSVAIVITKANATITVNGYSGVYDGLYHGATLVSAVGVNSEDLTGSVTMGGETFKNVPGGLASWSFSNGNYNPQSSNSVAIVITKANATITVNGYSGVYDGLYHGATLVSAVGVNSEDLTSSVTMGGETFKNVPGGLASWSFSNGNYNPQSSNSVAIVITKANAVVVVAPYTVTYDGNAHTAGITSITGVNGETGATVGTVDVSNTTHTNAGTYNTDFWSFTGGANYNNISNTTITDTINKANANCSVTGYSVVYDGLAHTATVVCKGVLGETLSGLDLSGTTHISAGDYLTDPWTFTDVTGNYNNTGGTVHDNIHFAICILYDQSKSHKSGSTVPLKLQLCGANGVNYSLAGIVVTATTLKKSDNSASPTLDDSGYANSPDMNFRYDATLAGYIFNLSTKGLTTGTWNVAFTVNGVSDPSYFVHFDIK